MTTGREMHLAFMIELTSDSSLAIPVPGSYELGTFLELAAC